MAIKPPRLKQGDTIGVIAPASAPQEANMIDKGKAALEKMGYRVVLGKFCREKVGFLAGTDRQRLADLHAMFQNPRINAIFCLRGGYGTARLLRNIDFRLIRRNPKIFVGFSDITALHLAFLKKANLVSFHGPMVTANLIKKKSPPYTRNSLFRILSEPEPFGSIRAGSDVRRAITIRKGKAQGALTGGNLSIIVTSLGTPYEIVTRGKIVFIEDIDEAPYRMDRQLTHLINAGKLRDAKGIVVGKCAGCDVKRKRGAPYTQGLEDVIRDRLYPLKIPVLMNMPFGHVDYLCTLPLGVRATLNATKGDLIIEQSAVK